MEVITTRQSHNLNIYKYFKNLNSCFIDIETTGLNRNKQIIYLIGLLFYDKKNGDWVLNQYFSNDINSEKILLETFIKDVASFDNLISYNGDRFDIPFINHRLKFNSIDNIISIDKSYDLYKTIKSNNDFLKLENLKLKTVESSLGYYREDIYSGFECIKFFYEYIKDKDPMLKERILRHNRDDLFYMLDIIEILDVIHSKKTIPIKSNSLNFTINTIDFEKDSLHIDGFIDRNLSTNIKFFSDQYNVSTDQYRRFNILIYVKHGYVSEKEKAVYIDTLDYPDMDLYSSSIYNIPENIFILKVEKDLYLDNIKLLLKIILENTI